MCKQQGDVETLHSLLWIWFGTQKPLKQISSCRLRELWTELWFAKGDRRSHVDEHLNRFKPLLDCEWVQQDCHAWKELGLLVLYDQVPRNVYRGTSQAYAYDHKALDLAKMHCGSKKPCLCTARWLL